MVTDWLLGIFGSYFSSGLVLYWFYPLIGIYLIGCVPALIRHLASWR